MMLTIFFN